MAFTENLIANRYQVFTGTLEDANGNPIVITSGSQIVVTLFRGAGADPDLVVNATPLAGGSVTTFVAGAGATQGQWQVQFYPTDTESLTALTYDCEVDLIDAGDSNLEKPADRGVFNILGQP